MPLMQPVSQWLSPACWCQPQRIETEAAVTIEKIGEGFRINRLDLSTAGHVPDIDATRFRELAKQAKTGCPVSQALTGTTISLTAELVE